MVLFGDIKLTQCCKDVNVTNTRDTPPAGPVLHCTGVLCTGVLRGAARRIHPLGLAARAQSAVSRQRAVRRSTDRLLQLSQCEPPTQRFVH